MPPEEENTDIWDAFANDEYLPQEPEPKQALGTYSLVQPRGTTLKHDPSALIESCSQDG